MAVSTVSIIDELIYDIQQASATTDNVLTIIEFVDTEIDKAKWGIDLNLNQRAILKAYYNLKLSMEEECFLESLKYSDIVRTTWDANADTAAQYLVLECGRRGSKCFSASSLLYTKDYGMVTGVELFEKLMSVNETAKALVGKAGLTELKDLSLPLSTTVAIEGTESTALAQGFYVKGYSDTKKITTSCGYEIEATSEHRIKVIDKAGEINWRYFSEIQAGEFACIHRSTNLFPQDYIDLGLYNVSRNLVDVKAKAKLVNYQEPLDKNWGALLGLLVGDGSWTNQKALQLTLHKQDLNHYLKVLENALKLQDNNLHLGQQARANSLGLTLGISSILLRKFFNNLGFVTDSTPSTKKVPWSIRQSPKDVQAAFISNLFAADGCLGKGGRDVSLSTASKYLAAEVQLMLLNFGIVSRIATRVVNGIDYYQLILRGKRSLEIFARDITFGLPRKQDPLVAYLATTFKDGGDTERIPYQKEWLQRIRATLPDNTGKQPGSHHAAGVNLDTDYKAGKADKRNLKREFRALVGNAIKENCTELLSSYRLNAIIAFAEEHSSDKEAIDHFKAIRECNYFYDPIVLVEDSEAFCVDLSVPGVEQYVGQGFTNHNSSLCSVIVAYEFYKLCHIPNPQKYYEIGANTPITLLILATTAEQAKGTIFAQISGLFKYVKYFQPLMAKKLVVVGAEEITYKSKQISIKSGNSKSSSQVGYSIICLVMDEVARMEGNDVEDDNPSALSMWANLGASGISFGKDARRIALSSAWFEGDPIEKLYDFAKTDPTYIGFRLATWQLNPKYGRDNPIVASAYNSNSKLAALEYEGIRSGIESGFFESDEITRCFTGDVAITTSFSLPDRRQELIINKVVPAQELSCAYLDPAITKDSYTFAFGRKILNREGDTIYYVDGVLVWEPDPQHKVSIVHVQNCIKQVHLARPIYALGADHHNSAETVERLNMSGIRSTVYTASNPMQLAQYTFTRELMRDNRLVLPKSSPWRSKLQDELTRVHLIRGVKIDHPKTGSKDISDAVCGLCWLLERTQLTTTVFAEVVDQVPDRLRAVKISTNTDNRFNRGRSEYFKAKRF